MEPDYDGKGVHEPNSARTSSHDMAGTSGEGVRGGADGSGASGPGSAASPVPGDAAGEKPTPQVLPHDGDATHDDEDVLECHEDELIETDAAMMPAAGEAEPSNSQGGASHGHSGGGSGHSVDDEGMILLPKGTKVEVKGNNRTKQSLVGKAGVVKKAIGLGGWHWLVLETGEEVKLQRNALTVLAVPSSPELDNSEDDAAAGGKASREVNKAGTGGGDGHGPRAGGRSTRRSAPVPATVRPPAGDSAAMQHAMQQLIGHPYEKPVPRVKFLKLDTSALRRYQEFFGLASPAELTKEELAEAIQAHFEGSEVNERDVVGNFVQAAKRVRSSF